MAGLRFFGSPVSCGRSHNSAFQSERVAAEASRLADQAVADAGGTAGRGGDGGAVVDMLVTHGPGDELAAALRPRVHCWGHAHGARGVRRRGESLGEGRPAVAAGISVNACVMDGSYTPTGVPIVVDLAWSAAVNDASAASTERPPSSNEAATPVE